MTDPEVAHASEPEIPKEEVEEVEEQLTIADAGYTLQNVLKTLIPDDEIEVQDVLGGKHMVRTVASARVQIKVLRQFEKLKSLSFTEMPFANDASSMFDLIMSVADNDDVLRVISNCFSVSQPLLIASVKKKATEQGFPFEDSDLAAADLFPLEEMIAAIIPLFIRLARKASQAVKSITANM
ncbi:MAG TPA: hypothetical protein EYN67_06655 [Flavobacteriales bacterium]|nr:hypothetical protein [Flavobacteriales bacterium]